MTTIKITARDSSTAMEEVSKKLGADAYILSTTSNSDGVEIEATNDPLELKKFSNKPKKSFSNLMKKQLGNIEKFPIPKPHTLDLNILPGGHNIRPEGVESGFAALNKNITKLTNEIRGMYITGSEGLGVEIGDSTFVKLQQAGFDLNIIKSLSPSFNGLNFERGRAAFMTSLAKSLTIDPSAHSLNRITFINGLSGVGKTTLTAKLSANQAVEYTDDIALAKLSYASDLPDGSLRSHARMLNKPVLRLNPDNLMESLCSTKSKILIDVSLEPNDAVSSLSRAVEFLGQKEVTSIIAIPGGASKSFIKGQANLFKDIQSRLALTKLDECDVSSTEMSEFFINSMKVHYLTGSKSIVGGLSSCSSEILAQYLVENC